MSTAFCDKPFGQLETVQFQERMKPAALRVYQGLWPGSNVQDLRENGVRVHILDKEFGIDSLLLLRSGQWISLQEKYRQNKYWHYRDFTQEFRNASGTEHESPGEWFNLGAQLYFYGWANEQATAFEHWLLLHVSRYKLLVERLGGLDQIGQLWQNRMHGAATFYSIPLWRLIPAILRHALPAEVLLPPRCRVEPFKTLKFGEREAQREEWRQKNRIHQENCRAMDKVQMGMPPFDVSLAASPCEQLSMFV